MVTSVRGFSWNADFVFIYTVVQPVVKRKNFLWIVQCLLDNSKGNTPGQLLYNIVHDTHAASYAADRFYWWAVRLLPNAGEVKSRL